MWEEAQGKVKVSDEQEQSGSDSFSPRAPLCIKEPGYQKETVSTRVTELL